MVNIMAVVDWWCQHFSGMTFIDHEVDVSGHVAQPEFALRFCLSIDTSWRLVLTMTKVTMKILLSLCFSTFLSAHACVWSHVCSFENIHLYWEVTPILLSCRPPPSLWQGDVQRAPAPDRHSRFHFYDFVLLKNISLWHLSPGRRMLEQ